MTHHTPDLDPDTLPRLARDVGTMGYEIVDIAGFLEQVESNTTRQSAALSNLSKNAKTVMSSSQQVQSASNALKGSQAKASEVVADTVSGLRDSTDTARDMAQWVQHLSERTTEVNSTLGAVGKNNQQIASIARQVNTLAINAKIEAARAGEAGRGFSVVADAINELSQQTSQAAVQITENVEKLTQWIVALSAETRQANERAARILELAGKSDGMLIALEDSMREGQNSATKIAEQSNLMNNAIADFAPKLEDIDNATSDIASGVTQAHHRIERLIDTSEAIVQGVAAMGATGEDSGFITHVQSAAHQISALFDQAVQSGTITQEDMFDQRYIAIPNTDPEQVKTGFTDLTDDLLPSIQEGALDLDPKVVFCAAVDTNGYLPTHNTKFSQPQSGDPVWNMANCRNRRIFDDRVGLKAGRNTEPFLLQVYRRDMGGGAFAMMKDISAPIFVQGKHWGGLRLAVKF